MFLRRGRIVWPSARAWKARRVNSPRGFKSLPLRLDKLKHDTNAKDSCVSIAPSGAGSCAAEHCEPRQGRKAATVSGPPWVTWGCLVCWRSVESTRIFLYDFPRSPNREIRASLFLTICADKTYKRILPARAGPYTQSCPDGKMMRSCLKRWLRCVTFRERANCA